MHGLLISAAPAQRRDFWNYYVRLSSIPLLGSLDAKLTIICNKVIMAIDSDYQLESDVLKIGPPPVLAFTAMVWL